MVEGASADLSAKRSAEGGPPDQHWLVGSRGDPTVAKADARWMRRALEHARRGLGRTSPNPVVGACIVNGGVVVGDGAHERAGEAHAEVHALEEAGPAAQGATLYCTLEPCSHTGRTGPCTERIIAAGVRRVVAAMEDPFPLVQGRGIAALRAAGIQVDVGVGRAVAIRLNQPFLTTIREGRPFVILKAATSLDGRVAAARGARTAITSAPALRHAQYVRAQVDAIGVGSETILVDDPLLTVRDIYRERPLTRVIFDRRGRVSPASRVFTTRASGPVIIVGRTNIAEALRELSDLGIQSLLIEGGPTLQRAVWDAGVVDYVQLYVAPVSLGEAGVPWLEDRRFHSMDLFERRVDLLGPDVLIEGYVHRPD
jgi:diaminohydroxyphosphoribosylaminopyrimidine deaminase/5-amino-6-(5-phosphoribosylamino)uracil reductase